MWLTPGLQYTYEYTVTTRAVPRRTEGEHHKRPDEMCKSAINVKVMDGYLQFCVNQQSHDMFHHYKATFPGLPHKW